jgi:flavin reductase (DIM6/NTAB) family NADH-FMN oxidoreductase RutF/uncharacterized Fe-S cluster protein YjdI
MDDKVLQKLSYGMYIIGAKHGQLYNGQVAHRVYQTPSNPPTVAVSINRKNLTYDFIKDSGQFTISVLEQGTPLRLINKLGYKSGREFDKYLNLDYQLSPGGIPYLTKYTLAYLEARVIQAVDVDEEFTVFIALVTEAVQLKEGTPMPFSFKYLVKKSPTGSAVSLNQESQEHPKNETLDLSQDKYECQVCGLIYDPAEGEPDYGVPRGTPFGKLPKDWTCPLCDEGLEVFSRVTDEVKATQHKEYRSDNLVVHWYPEMCSHSAKCIKLSPSVFDTSRRPWVDIGASTPEEIIQTVDRCPSGALKYSLPPGSSVNPELTKGVGSLDYEKEHPAAVKIRVIPNGPLLVEGPVTIEKIDGNLLNQGSRFALCRCGLTKHHPFCDNNHHRQGWRVDPV